MKLYINKDIAADADKMRYWMTGQDAVSYSDISGFLDYCKTFHPNDNRIDVELHSCGGDCTEGYAIYDALRASGKEISCTVVGQCASMATVILLAAPVERRTMYEHASMLIHEPYFPEGIQGKITINKLESIKNDLAAEKAKMMKVYVERTGMSEEVLEQQVASGDWFGVDKAIELGFISSVVPVASAVEPTQQYSTTKPQKKEMKINETSAVGKALASIAKALGVVGDDKPVGMTITDVNGTEIEIEREEGEVQVGDTTTAANGEYTLEDGRIIVVQDGTITEIKEAEDENDDTEDTEALQQRISELEAQVSELTMNAKTEDENNILAYVAKAGGLEKLKKTTGKYTPAGRSNAQKPEDVETNEIKKAIEDKKKAAAGYVPYWRK